MNPIAMSSTAFIPRSVSVLCATVSAALLGACGSMDRPLRTPDVSAAILAEIPEVAPRAQTVVPAKVSEALAEPAPPVVAPPPEPRLDLLVNNAQAREVFDVSGAGDTVIATLACAVGSGMSLPDSVTLANKAGGVVVGKLGTAVILPEELQID